MEVSESLYSSASIAQRLLCLLLLLEQSLVLSLLIGELLLAIAQRGAGSVVLFNCVVNCAVCFVAGVAQGRFFVGILRASEIETIYLALLLLRRSLNVGGSIKGVTHRIAAASGQINSGSVATLSIGGTCNVIQLHLSLRDSRIGGLQTVTRGDNLVLCLLRRSLAIGEVHASLVGIFAKSAHLGFHIGYLRLCA